jgi:heme-degrading monooxygenase HmoA
LVRVLSRFVIANGMAPEVKQAFLLRPHLVDNAPGFVRLNVLSPEDMPNEIWLMTYWDDSSQLQDMEQEPRLPRFPRGNTQRIEASAG